MEYQSTDDPGQAGGPGQTDGRRTSFIGSFMDTPEHGLIVLRGDLGADAVARLDSHVDAFVAGPTRYLMIDARAVASYHGDLLDLLWRTQNRLVARRGMLEVRGLHPGRLAAPVTVPAGTGPAAVSKPAVC